jgi:hypothetical protein
MKTYQKPGIHSESVECMNAVGQYIFEFTPDECLGLVENGAVGLEGELSICGDPGELGFLVDISCANIEGTYHVVYGEAVAGGESSCNGDDVSVIFPILSVNPELPADCTVISFEFDGGFDECNDQ